MLDVEIQSENIAGSQESMGILWKNSTDNQPLNIIEEYRDCVIACFNDAGLQESDGNRFIEQKTQMEALSHLIGASATDEHGGEIVGKVIDVFFNDNGYKSPNGLLTEANRLPTAIIKLEGKYDNAHHRERLSKMGVSTEFYPEEVEIIDGVDGTTDIARKIGKYKLDKIAFTDNPRSTESIGKTKILNSKNTDTFFFKTMSDDNQTKQKTYSLEEVQALMQAGQAPLIKELNSMKMKNSENEDKKEDKKEANEDDKSKKEENEDKKDDKEKNSDFEGLMKKVEELEAKILELYAEKNSDEKKEDKKEENEGSEKEDKKEENEDDDMEENSDEAKDEDKKEKNSRNSYNPMLAFFQR